jgi:hypothetical protein
MFLAVSGVGRRDADARYSGVLRKIVDRLLGAFSHFFWNRAEHSFIDWND